MRFLTDTKHILWRINCAHIWKMSLSVSFMLHAKKTASVTTHFCFSSDSGCCIEYINDTRPSSEPRPSDSSGFCHRRPGNDSLRFLPNMSGIHSQKNMFCVCSISYFSCMIAFQKSKHFLGEVTKPNILRAQSQQRQYF